MKVTGKPGSWLYPAPPVLVSSQSAGTANIITLAWAGVACSKPAMISLGIRPERHSHAMIKESGEFVVNIPKANQMELVDICGTISGREYNKFDECGWTALPGHHVAAPLIAECPVNLECRVSQVIALGSHDLFLGEVVLVHYDEEFMVDGRFDVDSADPMAYAFGRYYRLGEVIGRHGESMLRKRRETSEASI